MEISIYGAGHLTKSLLKGLSLYYKQPIRIFNRTYEKILPLKKYYKYIEPCTENTGLAENKSYIFMIISALGIYSTEENFRKKLRESDSILVSCGYFNTLEKLNELYPDTKIIRLSPNINWQIAQGVTLYSKNNLVTDKELEDFLQFLNPISSLIKMKDDEEFDNLGKITACGPALYMSIIENLCDSFGISEANFREAVYKTISGVFEYASQTGINPKEIIEEVANKGGITESGISAINRFLPPAFAEVKEKMIIRTDFVKNNLDNELKQPKKIMF